MDMARRAAVVHAEAAGRRPLRLETETDTLVGEWDPVGLGRVVDNLLSNAIKYSPDGSAIAVTIGQDGEANEAVLSVRDEGIGIPQDDLPRVFERFHRARNVAGRIKGIGIGLAGVKQIVEQHGGTIALKSTQGLGTTVTVRLPLA